MERRVSFLHVNGCPSVTQQAGSVFTCVFNLNVILGADYMANFSPVSRAEISAWLPEQMFLKRRLRVQEESFTPG